MCFMRTLTVILISSLLLTACGYKGALFLPTDADKAKRASPPAASAPVASTAQQASEPEKEQR